jgi:predicted chitinase
MSLEHEQAKFLVHVGELLKKAGELGFLVTGGELYRTPEQQALYVQSGRSKTMKSQHTRRLAVDLNFYREQPDGALDLVYDEDDLRPLGEFWSSLDSANRWGGDWGSFKDLPHFERQEVGAAVVPVPVPEDGPVSAAFAEAVGNRGIGAIGAAVGPQCTNGRDDTETVQRLLNFNAELGRVRLDAPLKPDGIYGTKTAGAIAAFQSQVVGQDEPELDVGPRSLTLRTLCAPLPEACDATLLSLIYLRAADEAVADLAPGIVETMAKRAIDTPLRQVHFIAQIGHESGELRFREEIASGAAYEGRRDLGNTQPGDGRRFKGRGLIQLTGRANYTEYAQGIGRKDEILRSPEIIAIDPVLCVDVAGWFWEKRKLNVLADRDDLIKITRRINGGTNGLDDRRRLLVRAKALFGLD